MKVPGSRRAASSERYTSLPGVGTDPGQVALEPAYRLPPRAPGPVGQAVEQPVRRSLGQQPHEPPAREVGPRDDPALQPAHHRAGGSTRANACRRTVTIRWIT